MVPFQDVSYVWNFGDNGSSGDGNWQYGAQTAYTSRNTATGAIAGHLYIVPSGGGDKTFTAIVTAYDGVNTAQCGETITAFDPNGPNGFAGAATTCVSSSGKPVAGTGGCPSGARVQKASNVPSIFGSTISGKRFLFKCGDTFTGVVNGLNGTKWSIGAYGNPDCSGTQTNRPIFSGATSDGIISTIQLAMTAGDGRIADLDMESANGFSNGAVGTGYNPPHIPYQITMSNLKSNGNKGGYSWNWGAQFALINSTMTHINAGYIGSFINVSENLPKGGWTGNVFNNLDYQAIIGGYFDGPGAAGCTQSNAGLETVRVTAGRMMVFENSTFLNANCTGAVLKIHNGNFGSVSTWSGIYTEYVMSTDNYYGGTSSAQQVENAPQGSPDDERLRYIVNERNLFGGPTCCAGGRQLLIDASNESVRNNIFYEAGTPSAYPLYGVNFIRLSPTIGVDAANNEAYNNTCYAPNNLPGEQDCIGFTGVGGGAPGINSFARNNLFYNPHNTGIVVANTGTGNVASNNTVAVTKNPGFVNGSGRFTSMTDFKPTANYTIGCVPLPSCTAVPVQTDAAGVSWSPIWDWGAVHH